MSIFTAAKALLRTQQVIEAIDVKQLLIEIEKAANGGKFYLFVKHNDLIDKEKLKLESLGYVVTGNDPGRLIKVSWEP
jgi:hypothetical protein